MTDYPADFLSVFADLDDTPDLSPAELMRIAATFDAMGKHALADAAVLQAISSAATS